MRLSSTAALSCKLCGNKAMKEIGRGGGVICGDSEMKGRALIYDSRNISKEQAVVIKILPNKLWVLQGRVLSGVRVGHVIRRIVLTSMSCREC